MSNFKCLQDLESGYEYRFEHFSKSSKSRGRSNNGSQSHGHTDQGRTSFNRREQVQGHMGVGDGWRQSRRDCDLPQISSDNENALTHRVTVSIGYYKLSNLKHLKNCKDIKIDTTIFILWYHKDETTAKMLVKINLIKEQSNSCPPFYPEEHTLGIHGKLAFASPHGLTLSDSGHSPSALISGCF